MVIILWWHKVPSFLPLCVYHCLNTSILWTGQKRPRNRTGLDSRPTPQTGIDSLKQDTENYCYCTVMYIRTIFTRASTMGSLYQTPDFDEGRISSWLTVKSLATDMNTYNITTLVQLHARLYIAVGTASIPCNSYCRTSDFNGLWIFTGMSFSKQIRKKVLKIWQLVLISKQVCSISPKV